MSPYLAEFIGTTLLIVFGNGVVANVVLARTKGHGGGWIVITAGWAFAVFIGASVFLPDPIFQGLALSLMDGEVASLLFSRFAVPVLYYMMNIRHDQPTGTAPAASPVPSP